MDELDSGIANFRGTGRTMDCTLCDHMDYLVWKILFGMKILFLEISGFRNSSSSFVFKVFLALNSKGEFYVLEYQMHKKCMRMCQTNLR